MQLKIMDVENIAVIHYASCWVDSCYSWHS